ncbi:DUF1499 domain-containing protein [Pelagibacterium sediminicola]|uniref:DUF1499 domain-containing protein n=1 Tax=Pelagibacterium sediminicola TaxID=2248761 RepID=UPI000E31EF76|nr:DUF1499 domain-containing protein [Pelagibacterium sediminicola]
MAVLVVATPLHIFDLIATDVFGISLAIGFGTAALALLLGLFAYVRLWFTGDRGWRPASFGVAFGLICLLPVAAAGYLAVTYPATTDISTALASPPDLIMARAQGTEIDPELILVSYPNLITRFYQIPSPVLFDLAQTLARRSGWQVISALSPADEESGGTLNAIRRSLLGWSTEIAFRVSPGPIGALIDLRAASLFATPHDLGENGRAIEDFLRALDQSVTEYIQANLAAMEEDTELVTVEGLEGDGGE